MKRILTNPSNGLLTQRMRLFEKDGLELRVAGESVIEKLVDQIMVIDENVLNGGKPVFMRKEDRNESIVRMDKRSRSRS